MDGVEPLGVRDHCRCSERANAEKHIADRVRSREHDTAEAPISAASMSAMANITPAVLPTYLPMPAAARRDRSLHCRPPSPCQAEFGNFADAGGIANDNGRDAAIRVEPLIAGETRGDAQSR